jgi:hypothetical protein
MNWLWPVVTGKSFFDLSTIIHFCFWVVAGSGPAYMGWGFTRAFLYGLIGAIGWEVFERYAETLWPHIWKHPESTINSFGSDLLTVPLGIWLAYILVENQ